MTDRAPDAWLYENAVQLVKLTERDESMVARGYTETPLFYRRPAAPEVEAVACNTCKDCRYLITAPSTCSAGGERMPCPSCIGTTIYTQQAPAVFSAPTPPLKADNAALVGEAAVGLTANSMDVVEGVCVMPLQPLQAAIDPYIIDCLPRWILSGWTSGKHSWEAASEALQEDAERAANAVIAGLLEFGEFTTPTPVEDQETVAFVQEWLMSGDHEPTQWEREFATAIDARTAVKPVEERAERAAGELRILDTDLARLSLWQAIEAIKIGNKHDDKPIIANLAKAGVYLAQIGGGK